MSQYLVLSKIKVQKANCIAGFTWGFPAITHFLGFTHALQRKLVGYHDIAFSGCAVISHDYQLHVYKSNPKGNFEFIQSKNPAVLAKHKTHSSPPIIEEGKMNLTVSLVIEFSKELVATSEQIESFKKVQQFRASDHILQINKIRSYFNLLFQINTVNSRYFTLTTIF